MKRTWSTALLLSLLTSGCLVGPLDTDRGPRGEGSGGATSDGTGAEGGGSGSSTPSGGSETGGKGGSSGGSTSGSGGSDTGGTDAGGASAGSGGEETGGAGGNSGGQETGGSSAGGSGGSATGGTGAGGETTGGTGGTDAGGSGGTSNRIELVSNGHFESTTAPWYAWNGTQLASTTARAHSGQRSLVATGTDTGPVAINLTEEAVAGVTYEISFWVTVGGVESAYVQATVAQRCGTSTSYHYVTSNDAVINGVWVELSGTFEVAADCDLQLFQPYLEGDGSDVDLYVDDVSVSYQ